MKIFRRKMRRLRLSKTFGMRERAAPFRILVGTGGVYGGPVPDFSQEKSLPCRFCARKSAAFQQNLVGWQWRGRLLPRHQLVKNLF